MTPSETEHQFFTKLALDAFRKAGHVFEEADVLVDHLEDNEPTPWFMALMDCQRCQLDYTFDSDTHKVIGGRIEDFVEGKCPGAKAKA